MVPIIGAGLSMAAGVPGFSALNQHLLASAAATGRMIPATGPEGSFGVANRLAREFGEPWVQEQASSLFLTGEPTITPTLRALAKVSSGVIITTNYDLAIERAAAAIDRPVRALTLDEFDLSLVADGAELVVLHLHGMAGRPETIVLTDASYERILHDERAQLVLRSLGVRRRFVFLGHSLGEEEVHLRRDLRWVFDTAVSVAGHRHLFVTNRTVVTDPGSLKLKNDLETAAGVRVVMFADPDSTFQAAVRAAYAIAGPSSVATEDDAKVLSAEEFDQHYLALPVADAEQISTAGGVGVYQWHVWQEGELVATALDDTEDRLVIEAGGGAGKSEELRQIARRSKHPALVQSLTSFKVTAPWHDAGARFVAGMASARAARHGVLRLTRERLRDESYTFLLDGLDEVSETNRPRLLDLLEQVVTSYPQHRYVLGSRPLPELLAQRVFRRWTPVPGTGWLTRYAANRSVDVGALNAALPENSDVADLITVPIFAAAVIDRIHAGRQLERTALELVCGLADARTVDPRIESDAGTLRVWLDRLAVALQLAGASELRAWELVASGLHAGLEGIDPTEQFIAELAARALLTDITGRIKFPANLIKEARAARALLLSGDEGLALLRNYVLVELDSTDSSGSLVRSVDPSWVNVVELLLPSAPEHWRSAVAEFDVTLVARSTDGHADEAHRKWAVDTLWQTYLERRIWLERGIGNGNGSGDADALVRLLQAGVPDGFAEVVGAALHASERTARGNAIELVPYLRLPLAKILLVLTNAVTDEDPVVRRRAAAGGWTIEATTDLSTETALVEAFVQALVNQAKVDPDETAVETLLSVAIDLAPDDVAAQIALQAPPRARRRTVADLVRRLDRSALLELLRAEQLFHTDLFYELVEARSFTERQAWSASEVVTLVHLIADHVEETVAQSDAQLILLQHPAEAILAWTCHPSTVDVQIELSRIVAGLDDQQMTAVAEFLERANSDAALVADGYTLDLETAEYALTLVRQRTEHMSRPMDISVPSLPSTAPSSAAAANEESASSEELYRQIRRLFEERSVANAFESSTGAVSIDTIRWLRRGADHNFSLSADDCQQLFELFLNYADSVLHEWLLVHWSEGVADSIGIRLATAEDQQVLRVAEFLPPPWTPNFGGRVLDAANSAADPFGLQLRRANLVANRLGEQFVRTWSTASQAHWIDPLLVRFGDCAAEERMITALRENPGRITRYPSRQDEEWISFIRCAESTESLVSLLRTAWAAGLENSDLEPLQQALNRCARNDAPRIWEELAGDASIPSASFLFYQRRTAITQLIDGRAGRMRIGDPALTDLVVALVGN
ncbi:SIR2 family protein [Kribbella sp. NPDC051952]|uniref:SIR2 family protein n=1 Tax=Kribbella sp. NPDC051952 TaxID=3154851 RepID=UPI00343738F5